jgi:hypothetical protein
MQSIDAKGQRLGPLQFIEWYKVARTLAPPRFLTLRMHPDRFKELYNLADIPESIQMGMVPGQKPGSTIWRVACIKPPSSVYDGIAIKPDAQMDPTKLEFQIHGVIEMIVENIHNDSE